VKFRLGILLCRELNIGGGTYKFEVFLLQKCINQTMEHDGLILNIVNAWQRESFLFVYIPILKVVVIEYIRV
jgi:hypothetical protein